MSHMSDTSTEVQRFKLKKLLKSLRAAKGNGTSMISLLIRPNDQL